LDEDVGKREESCSYPDVYDRKASSRKFGKKMGRGKGAVENRGGQHRKELEIYPCQIPRWKKGGTQRKTKRLSKRVDRANQSGSRIDLTELITGKLEEGRREPGKNR